MRIGLLGFVVTTAVLIPAATLSLVAGPEQRAKLFAPGVKAIALDGAHVEAKIRRRLVEPGEAIHLALTTDKRVQVGVVVFGQTSSAFDRVPNPPAGVAHETIHAYVGCDDYSHGCIEQLRVGAFEAVTVTEGGTSVAKR
jgi:hypothetical protein